MLKKPTELLRASELDASTRSFGSVPGTSIWVLGPRAGPGPIADKPSRALEVDGWMDGWTVSGKI